MPRKSLSVVLSVAFILVLAGFMIGPGSQSSSDIVQQIASAINPSATPTSTNTPTATATPTDTPEPTDVSADSPTLTSIFGPSRTPTLVQTTMRTLTLNPNTRVLRVPILMYHYISTPPLDADIFRLDLSVLPREFEAQMEWLAVNGYHPIRLMDLAYALQSGAPLPDKPIVLSFDDGYVDFYQNALPILKNYRFPATIFVITQFSDDGKPGYLTWQQMGEVARAGIEIGSHTQDHPDLRTKSFTFLNQEILGSKQTIELRLGVSVRSFAYPSGKYDARTISVVQSSGYSAAVTEIPGMRQTSDKLMELKRIRIRGSYNITDFSYWLNWFASRPE